MEEHFEHMTKVSLCDQINMPFGFKSETEQIDCNDSILNSVSLLYFCC